jgi:DNA replication protein DnaC
MKQIESQLHALRLHGMSQSWEQLKSTRQLDKISFTEGLEILLQAEEDQRQDRRYKRLEYLAGFRYKASVQEVITSAERGMDPALLARLATGSYIDKGEAILITGPTGCGKSFLASALGQQACLAGKKVLYFNTQKLMQRLKLLRLDGSIHKFFEKVARTDLLIIDDFGMRRLENQQQSDLMEIIEDRHNTKSTIIASQLPVSNWYDVIGEETIADAILDRLVNTAHLIQLAGESMRKKR